MKVNQQTEIDLSCILSISRGFFFPSLKEHTKVTYVHLINMYNDVFWTLRMILSDWCDISRECKGKAVRYSCRYRSERSCLLTTAQGCVRRMLFLQISNIKDLFSLADLIKIDSKHNSPFVGKSEFTTKFKSMLVQEKLCFKNAFDRKY